MILRVFPRATAATPTDDMVRYGSPDWLDPPDCDEVHVSVAFSWDKSAGERLADEWSAVHNNVSLGGPAISGSRGEFVPGRYLKLGHTITSRGCPRACWFCRVPKYEGPVATLPIRDGWIVHDSNLLACPSDHILAVFEMLRRQTERVVLAGGVDPRLVRPWHVEEMRKASVARLYTAYDTPDDAEPLVEAGRLLKDGGMTRSSHLYCYILVGYPGDSFGTAEERMRFAWDAGFCPAAMLYRDEKGDRSPEWKAFGRTWNRPAIVRAQFRATAGAMP